MRRTTLLILMTCLILLTVSGGRGRADDKVLTGNLPEHWRQAVVRIPSHGLSGTIIQTEKGRTLILSSAHGWIEGKDRRGVPVTVDVPMAEGQPAPTAGGRPRLVAIDPALDLALVELPAGPFPAAIPVAPKGTPIGSAVRSAGYDEMRWQDGPLIKSATVIGHDGTTVWTKEIPWHGRSGGILLDAESGTLIGVVQGYMGDPRTGKMGPGMYVSAVKVRGFLAKAGVRAEDPQDRPADQGLTPRRYGDGGQGIDPPQALTFPPESPRGNGMEFSPPPLRPTPRYPDPPRYAQPQPWAPGGGACPPGPGGAPT